MLLSILQRASKMKKIIAKIFLLLFLIVSPFAYSEEGCFYVLKEPKPETGMFAAVQTVLCFLDVYEKHGGDWSGVEVNFGTEGLYWVANKGHNWWQYYFDPICIKKTRPKSMHYLDIFGLQKLCLQFGFHPIGHRYGNYLIQKYVKVKDAIQKKANSFYKKNLRNAYLIGVHYRGTDKVTEAPRVPYDQVYAKIMEVMKTMPKKEVKIFVATDEQQFISYITNKFPHHVYYTIATRAADSLPVHIHHNLNPYENGVEALVDCLLLSKCRVLIRTESHLSNTALMFNPDIIPHTLNCYK